ncbi:Alpha-tocopherol transfer protein-like protein [Ooceraea biroi]|uniref:Alpha-tocopherol transfer protein-like protein n=1 Tax=Ooceraea biroi TaxID=2015173 RepID=A0A026W0V4_OOCBI|nr:Alpha-tocopherol transfer protein-like protein [Ooceraea biroi]
MSSIKHIILEEEMKKIPELKMSDIEILRQWCEKQPHLPKIQDVEFAVFLHCNYYRIEPTKNTIENYYTFRTHLPEFFSNRDMFKNKELQRICKVVAQVYLKEMTKEGYNIQFGRFIDLDPSHYDFNSAGNIGFMINEEFLWNHSLTPGYIYVADATGLSFGHVGRLNPMQLKKFFSYVQLAFPVRLKAIHVINISPVVEIIYNMVKPFLQEELIQLIHFHPTLEDAKKYFPIDALPNEFGGKAGPVKELMEEQIEKLENFCGWFVEDEKINRVNESLRIGKNETSNTLFGMDGTFRKLDID